MESKTLKGWIGFWFLAFMWVGWGAWGRMGVYGDHALELSDALRIHQGEVPFRDFLPTYAPLVLMWLAPLFKLETFFYSVWWCLSGLWVLGLTIWVTHFFQKISARWGMASLFLACVGFPFNNSSVIQGYSVSGGVGVGIWLGILWFFRKKKEPRWDVLGFLLALPFFLKLDLGLAAIGFVVVFWVLSEWGGYSCVRRLCLSMILTMIVGVIGVGIWAGGLKLYLTSIHECFAQAGIFGDTRLKQYLGILFVIGSVFFVGLWTGGKTRKFFRTLAGWCFQFRFWILSFVLLGDIVRGWKMDSLRSLVFFHGLEIGIWLIYGARASSTWLRHPSRKNLRRSIQCWFFPAWLIGGAGIFRVYFTGWYPLNYYEPCLILILGHWLWNREGRCFQWDKRLTYGVLTILLCFVWIKNARVKSERTWVKTPYGSLPLVWDKETVETIREVLAHISVGGFRSDTFYSSYEPSLQLLSGMRSACFYTYNGRLGFCGKYQMIREEQSFNKFKEHPPRFVFLEKERAVFSRFFGKDFGLEILSIIDRDYFPVWKTPERSLIQGTLLKRREN